MSDFNNQKVLITGATRGIGKAAAELFLKKGASVIGTGTSDECPDKAKLNLIGDYQYLKADFSNKKGITDFIDLLDTLPRIDACINNAGINRLHDLEDIPDDAYEEVMSVNLHAPVRICRYLAKRMKKQEYGRVVNVASIWSVITKPKRTIYTISKSAIIGLTKTMSVELAPYGITVNAISPGFTMTELTESTLSQEEIDNLAEQVPARRFADPKEMGEVMLFLCSKENSYMTGQNIIVDGGFTNV